ncbi:hypothetical protein AYL99_01541 [Fonsecaea erecta]|uniref:Aminodeoxychorismate lyase n=1 Tax=Fonsecaea erecta TaxID=1367422 RepID=A0A179A0L6_9EURO|nr:hypothetical protein AYL99_01541 [Fonsecaea erecta]OAP65569.1 hypothetical protein AYL99_01541 [Fonsecaea erecta]
MSLRPRQEDDDAPTFRIITTLKHTLFNAQDAESADSRAHALVQRWKDVNGRLFVLHTRRLREAAEAFGWTDVATSLSPVVASATVSSKQADGGGPISSTAAKPVIRIECLVEEAAAATAASSPGPKRGFLRDVRVRVLIDRDGEVAVECTTAGMGEDRPLSTLTRALDMYTSCPFTSTSTVPRQGDDQAAAACQVTLDTQPTRPSRFTRHKTTRRTAYDEARARVALLPTTPPTTREVLLSNTDGQVTEASLSAVYFRRGATWLTPRSDCGGLQSVTRLYALEQGWCDEGTVLACEVEDGEGVWLSNAVRGFFPGVVRRENT